MQRLLLILILFISFSSCEQTLYDGDDLALKATFYDKSKNELDKFSLEGSVSKGKQSIIVDLGSVLDFNTITLGESSCAVEEFKIYISNSLDDEFNFIYEGDTIEDFRLCYLGDKSARFIKLEISSISRYFVVDRFSVYNKKTSSQGAKSVTYMIVDQIKYDSNFSGLDAVTDVIFFGTARYNKDGEIYFHDRAGVKTDESYYANNLNILKTSVGTRDIKIIAGIGVPFEDGKTKKNIYNMMKNNSDKAIENIFAFLEKYDFDGVDIDYEYPETKLEWSTYNDFLVKLKTRLGSKTLSVAVCPWFLKFSPNAIKSIDQVQLMLYDYFDQRGYHSAFYSCAVDGINRTVKSGFKEQQINFGLPFYGRPITGDAHWPSYLSYASELGEYKNLLKHSFSESNGDTYFYYNCKQIIKDKTAFAIDKKLGGVMTWHFFTDANYSNDLSLLKTIKETFESKN